MAQININDELSKSPAFSSDNNVTFFNLKSGEEAVVRIMIDSTDAFEYYTVHKINFNGKERKIGCIRNSASDAISKCPLCEAGIPVEKKFYIPMLQYFTNESGLIDVKPVIWVDRSTAMAKKVKSYLENYGPLSHILCKVIRKGNGLETEWEILPNPNPMVYKQELYPCKPELFNNYKALGTYVLNKDYDEIKTFISTGSFPQKVQQNTAPVQTQAEAYPEVLNTTNGFDDSPLPWDASGPEGVSRPTRTF